VVPRRKSSRNLLRGRRNGKGERIIQWNPMHINASILSTIITIAILMGTLRKSVGNYIQS
jgi:hypothetical protein